jgi:hypothetical protein
VVGRAPGPNEREMQVVRRVARFDAGRSIGMLGAAWDAAVVEYHNRWELAWEETYDTPEYDGCNVRIDPRSTRAEPTSSTSRRCGS